MTKDKFKNRNLISKFAGFEYYPESICPVSGNLLKRHWSLSGINHPFPRDTIYEDTFKFHSSWSWLMPIIARIETISYSNKNIAGYFEKKTYIHFVNGSIYTTVDIDGVYKEVIEFINWYNKNEKAQ